MRSQTFFFLCCFGGGHGPGGKWAKHMGLSEAPADLPPLDDSDPEWERVDAAASPELSQED